MKASLSFVAMTLAATACSSTASNPPFDAETSTETDSQDLYAVPSDFWTNKTIPVCWTTPGFATEKEWVRDAATRSWSRYTRVNFTGWGDCAPQTTGVRITVENGPAPIGSDPRWWGRPQVVGHAGAGPTLVSDMRLTFDFINAGFRDCQQPDDVRQKCVRFGAVHEFGHALGFQHEQVRPDASEECLHMLHDDGADGAGAGVPGGVMYGPFNRNGIMSYCADKWTNDGVLSPLDIVGAQRTQGRRPGGTLGTQDGRCLTVAGSLTDFTRVRARDCLSSTAVADPAQRWNVSDDGRGFRTGIVPEYLDIDDGTGNAMISSLVPIGSQVWTLRGGLLRGLGDLCIAPRDGTRGELALVECSQGVDKRFTFLHDGSVRLTAAIDSCLTTVDGPPQRVVLAACANDARQRWTLAANGSLRPRNQPSQCLEVAVELVSNRYSSDRFDGTSGKYSMALAPCHEGLSQSFSFEGEIVNELDQCLSATGGRDTPARADFCDYSSEQRWRYDW